MVHRQQWDTYWGAKKFNFLIRDIDGATRAAASMESSQFVVRRLPGSPRVGTMTCAIAYAACVAASVDTLKCPPFTCP